jgi:cysteine desulfurase
MSVNNETGVKTDVEAIAAIAYQANIPFIVDGVAWLGKEAISIPKGVSALFFSGHKIHAPKGIGFVFCRSSLKCFPLILGGHQEFNRRSGSENLPAIVGLGRAVEILSEEQAEATDLMRRMRDRLQEGLKREISDIVINGQGPRIVNTLNVSFLGVDGESLLMNLDLEGISVSHGSACTAGALEPSRILLNMGISLQEARTAIRFSVSRFTTEEEIDRCLEIIVKHVKRIRNR